MLIIDSQFINVKYFSPWKKNISIRIADISKIDYQKGFYDFFSEKAIGGIFTFPQYCYDRLIIHSKSGNILIVNINTRLFQFKKVLKWALEMKFLDGNKSVL
jgi:hypothetical protein